MKRILVITTGLETGGAEGILVSLISGLDRTKFEPLLINLGNEGPKLQEVFKSGCLYQNINFHRGFILFNLLAFYETVWSFKPHIIQGWMYQGSLFALFAKFLCPWATCFLGIRNYQFKQAEVSKSTYFSINLIKSLMFLSKKCIFPSKEAQALHENAGFLKNKSEIIENGCDSERFFPVSEEIRLELKRKWHMDQEKKVVGFVSRVHPHKDIETFLRTVALLLKGNSNIQVVCVGQGLVAENQNLMERVEELGLKKDILFLGVVKPVYEIYQMMDVLLLTSVSEAFPNVILEAMACEVPCVSTDVGNVRQLMGPFYRGANQTDAEKLALEVEKAIFSTYDQRKELRDRVFRHFSLQKMLKSYESLWLNRF